MTRLPNTEFRPINRIDQGKRREQDIHFVVIHDMESDNIDGVENYFRTSSPDEVGAHVGIDKFGNSRQWADLNSLVYHAKGGNQNGIGIELEGFAKQSRTKWLSRPRQLKALANRIAWICYKYELGMPHHGTNVRGHNQILAGGHWDPGPGFPWDDSRRGRIITRGLMYQARRAYRKLKRTNGKDWI